MRIPAEIMKNLVMVAQIPQQLRRMAARNDAITYGRIASCRELTVHQGPASELHALAVSPSGNLVIAKHDDTLVLSRISKDGGSPQGVSSNVVWSTPAPAAMPPWRYAHMLSACAQMLSACGMLHACFRTTQRACAHMHTHRHTHKQLLVSGCPC